MNLNIVKMGNAVLRTKTRDIPLKQATGKGWKAFLKRMVQTMHEAQGVGLAANQVGLGQRAFVMECRGNKRYPKRPAFPLQTYLNPRITRYSKDKVSDWEGCLSIPGFRGLVPRSRSVTLKALTPDGKRIQKTFQGFEARVVQHEVDHLNGFFYIDRMGDLKTWTHLEEFNKKFKVKVRDRKS